MVDVDTVPGGHRGRLKVTKDGLIEDKPWTIWHHADRSTVVEVYNTGSEAVDDAYALVDIFGPRKGSP